MDRKLGPATLPELEDRAARQTRAASALGTALAVTALSAGLATVAFLMSARLALAATSPGPPRAVVETDDPSGHRGTNYDFGDGGQDEPTEFDVPADPAPTAALLDYMTAVDPSEFLDPTRAQTGGSTPGGGPSGTGPDGPKPDWQIEYGAGDRRQYARILDHFGVQLAAFRGGWCEAAQGFADGAAVRRFDAPPAKRYFRLRDEARLRIDRELLAAAGVTVRDGDLLCQYVPDPVVDKLRQLERNFAGRTPPHIALTRFGIRATGDRQWEFFVLDQQPR